MKISERVLYFGGLSLVIIYLLLHNFIPDRILKYSWIPFGAITIVFIVREISKWLEGK
jgi:hypothetical protein